MRSPKTKNELMRERLDVLCHQNQVKFRYVLWDTWYSAAENMVFVVKNLNKHFVGAIKDNRKLALLGPDGSVGELKPVSQQELQPGLVYRVRMESVPFDLFLIKKVYKNIDGTTAVAFLVTSDGSLQAEQIFQLYQKRWKVEESHKSVKQNAGIAPITHQNGAITEKSLVCRHVWTGPTRKIENRPPNEPLRLEAMKLAGEMGRRVATGGEGLDIFEQYRKRLEQAGGLPIQVEENREIPTAAKIEFAENYNRDYHQIRFKPDYPVVDHLKMHEMVHLDLVIAARKASVNQLFISRPEHQEKFIRNLGDFIKGLHKKGYPEQQLANYLTALFEGLNRQIYNAPIDLFIEDFLFQEFPRLRPLQFLSLYRLAQEALQAVTDKRIVELSPRDILSKSKVLNMAGAMQFKMLYGLDLLPKYNATIQEKKEADRLFEEYLEYRPDRKPGEVYIPVHLTPLFRFDTPE